MLHLEHDILVHLEHDVQHDFVIHDSCMRVRQKFNHCCGAGVVTADTVPGTCTRDFSKLSCHLNCGIRGSFFAIEEHEDHCNFCLGFEQIP
jgi:hypothetical protein